MKPVPIFLRKLSLALLSGLILAAVCSCSTSAKDYHNQKSAFQYDTAGGSQSKSDHEAPEDMKASETDFMLGYFREIREGNLPAALSEKTLTSFNDTGKDLLYSIEKHTLKKLVIAYDLGPAPEKRSPFARICQVTDRMDFEIVFAKEVTSLYGLFEGCRLSALPKNLDTSRITDMSRMFAQAEIKTPFPELDTGNAVKMTAMFAGASFMSREAPNLNTSRVTSMQAMFRNTADLEKVPLYDTSRVKDFSEMFRESSVKEIPLFSTSQATNMEAMLAGAPNIRELPDFDLSGVKCGEETAQPGDSGSEGSGDSKKESCRKLLTEMPKEGENIKQESSAGSNILIFLPCALLLPLCVLGSTTAAPLVSTIAYDLNHYAH